MNDELTHLLSRGLEELGLEADTLLKPLQRYFSEILLWNPKTGLIKATEREIITKHFLDSAAAFTFFDEFLVTRGKMNVADLGSGAGLPGLVLALIFRDRPGFSMHLIEKRQRRAAFLHNVVAILGLRDCVQVHAQRVETLNPEYDIVTSRAFHRLSPDQCRLQMGLLKPEGRIVAYKGRHERIMEDFRGVLPEEGRIIPLKVPFLNEERHLVVLSNLLA